MMKGGKEEGKTITEPLFPRLHVNDREKGGPRAPPRNKMALYEQLSIPSQRFNSSSTSPGPISLHNACASSSQGYHQEISVLAPSDVPAQPSIHFAKRVCFRSSDSTSVNSRMAESVGTSKRQSNKGISIADGSAGNSLHLSGASNANQSHQKNFDDEDDFMVPTFVQSRTSPVSNKHLSAIESERITTSHVGNPQKNSSSMSPNFSGKSLKGTFTSNARLRNTEQKHIEQRQTAPPITKDSKRIPDCGRRFAELQNYVKTSSNQDDTGTATVGGVAGYDNAEYSSIGAVDGDRCIGTDVGSKGDNSRVRKESCSEASCRNNQVAPNEADKFNQESESNTNGPPELEDADKNEGSEASFPDSVSGTVVCPVDVVGVIGPMHFWKARRLIVNQQRIFAIQVFELHRLIKVQKSLAASPDVLKVDVYFSESPIEAPTKVMPPKNFEKSHQSTVAEEASSQKQNESNECPEAKTLQVPPASQTPGSGASPFPSAPDNRLNPWCMHPYQNQWLVPVMSPSEGLIYKPYPGPCPPTTSVMAPFFGGYAPPPLSFPPVSVDFMNPACGALPYPQQPPIYFPSPYTLAVAKQIMSSSTVEQVSPLPGTQPDKPDMHQSGSLCNVSNPRSDAISGQLQKLRASKGNEAQGSTLTIARENGVDEGKDIFPLFPATQNPNGTDKPLESADKSSENRVIRVVPHNARLASESAARIFRFIQQERKKYNL